MAAAAVELLRTGLTASATSALAARTPEGQQRRDRVYQLVAVKLGGERAPGSGGHKKPPCAAVVDVCSGTGLVFDPAGLRNIKERGSWSQVRRCSVAAHRRHRPPPAAAAGTQSLPQTGYHI